ncbi:epimerase [Halobacteriales archaeon QH_2_65_14]|nr:MAG: epimerase [Halobacteriales archaeon QH_2_65_14]
MTRTVVTGGTGRLGGALRPRLLDAGHEVRATSTSPPADGDVEWVTIDLRDGTGIADAVADADVVVHTASAPQGDSEAVDVEGTKRLLDAADDAGVSNFLYISIVGIDEIPFSYYEHKLAAERAIESSPVPSTILRATQFHSFVDGVLGTVSRLPVWPLPTKIRIQPVSVGEVADILVEHATPEPAGRLPDVGGPEVKTVGELATSYRRARGKRRPIVRLPIPGSVAGAFRAGKATCPDRAVGTVTWDAWLDEQYGPGESGATNPSATPS